MSIIDISYFVIYSVKMVDTSDHMVEYRVHTALFHITNDQTRHAIKLARDRLSAKYIEPPEHCIIMARSNKLLETGSLFDRLRSGRPTEQGDIINDVEKGVNNDPKSSVRRLSNELDISKVNSAYKPILTHHILCQINDE